MSIKRRRLDYHEIAKGELATRHVDGEENTLYLINQTDKEGKTFNVCDLSVVLPFKERRKQKGTIDFQKDHWYYFTVPNAKELKASKKKLMEKIESDPGTKVESSIQRIIKKIDEALSELGYDTINKKLPADYH
ncbi:TPA: hypothetical protein DCZ39_00940 [Patescibacteria group bacterium]|nr:hypothetical protein [Candidatus Gracilibacteria bacterium]